tara:strand:+ start:109 stop:501 length:393 start_codon:yes stop_codon:yes gene_type:complete
MPTTTTRLVISSADLLSSTLAIDATATLTQAGGSVAIAQTSGLGVSSAADTNIYTLYAAGSYNDNEAAKVYLRNASTDATHYVTVTIGSTSVGRLYAGDVALIPWDTTGDFKLTQSNAAINVEHILFHEG